MTILPLKYWFLLALFVGVGTAEAALNYRVESPNGTVGLRLSEAPCTEAKVLMHIKPSFHSKFKAAVLTYGGRDWHSCYIEVETPDQQGKLIPVIYSIDEEGSQFQPIPKRVFKDDTI